MSLRFALGSLFAVAGGFLAVTSFTFAPATASWLAFGVGTGVTVLAAAALAKRGATITSVGYAAAFAVGLWSLIAALIFTGDTLSWLVFADAVALVAVALADLGLHEISTERVVHTLDVHGRSEAVHAA